MANPSTSFSRKQTDPSLSDLMSLLKKDILLNFSCHAIATVQSFNSVEQTITATINYKKEYLRQSADGVYTPVLIDYPILLDVPVIVLGGGAYKLTFPITKGDECLILFNDRDIDNWFQTGQIGPVASGRLHSFSDGIALVGLNSLANSIENYDVSHAKLSNGETAVGVSETQVLIANADGTLNDALQDLSTQLQSLTTQLALLTVICAAPGNPSSVPVNAAAITTIGTNIGTIATQIAGLLE